LILTSSILAIGVSRINLVQDLNQSITGNKTVSSFFHLLDKKSVNKDITFIIENKNQVSFDSLQRLGEDFSKEALKQFPDCFEKLSQESEDPNEVYSYLLQHIPSYLDTSLIPKEINDFQFVERKIKENHAKLFTPEGIFLKPYLFKDPFGFVPSILLNLRKNYTSSALDVMDGNYILAKDSSLVIRGQFSTPFLTKKDKLKTLKKIETWSTNYFQLQKVSWDYFSTDRIALANAEQVKSDTILTLVVSLTAILLLLFLYYRKATLPFFFLVPGAFGVLFSLGLIGFIHPNITGLAIGTGAIVVGIIVDYSFHFFTHLKHTNSISETIIAISKPLIIACLTTILAFGALFFTHSVILRDFGLFASLSLVGTLLGVFVILPVILPKSWEKESEKEIIEEETEKKEPRFKNQRKWFLISTILISIFCIYELPNVEFEKDLEKLNFYPKEINDAEQKITGFIPADEKRIFVAVADKNEKKAQNNNIQLNQLLKQLHQEGKIDNFLNSAELVLTRSQEEERLNAWKTYWKNRKEKLFIHLDVLEKELGYMPTAFDDFKSTIDEQTIQNYYNITLINEIRSKLEDHSGNNFSYLSILSVPRNHLDEVKQILRKNNEFTVLDRADLANSIVKSVNDDFNYILYASTLIVFIVLLITFGRMELALITFIPMILSWIWILGFAAFFDIKFNLVNVVITTFIFGLGDDFAIFITEGYLIKYRTGKNYLRSFKTGTILSAATTILGTGVLLLAKHPAIHSIGLISIIGLSSILFMSLFVQPILIEWLITNRTEKKKAPWTLTGLLISIFTFTFFLSGCFVISVVQLLLRLIPFGRKRHKKILHYLFRDFSWAQLYVMLNVRKKVLGKENLNFNRPSIIIANHQSFIDILAMIMLDPRIILMTNNWVYKSFFFGRAVRFLDYLPNEKGVENMVEAVKSKIDKGYSVMIFPEGSRSKTDEINRFHKGAFYLADKLHLDITPIVLHGFNQTMAKSDFYLKNGTLMVEALPRILATDTSFGEGYHERNKKISKYFKTQYKIIQKREKDAHYIWPMMLSNYVYKIPSLEWYLRIKYMFEKSNYEHYNELLEERTKIIDLGCGYGFLSYYLKFANSNRQIFGVDYDEKKIELAENCYQKDEKISFKVADISEIALEPTDAVFLMDVLHYLPTDLQLKVLKNATNALNNNGLLIIRDGVNDLSSRHKKTEQTERYSTKIFKFNRVERELTFFNRQFIKDFAQEMNLSYLEIEQTNKTSNILFVLKKEL